MSSHQPRVRHSLAFAALSPSRCDRHRPGGWRTCMSLPASSHTRAVPYATGLARLGQAPTALQAARHRTRFETGPRVYRALAYPPGKESVPLSLVR
jgi:hypothetical protein